jgi:predicted TIM-barrel fold metal-dependent hydrolase
LRISHSLHIIVTVIIDFHTHIVSPGLKENRCDYTRSDACFSLLYSNPEARLSTAEELITSMDEHQISKSVILNIGWGSHELCRRTNDYLLESAARYPHRLIAFCVVQPLAGDKAIKEVERCVDNGARGMGEMRPDIQGYNLSDQSIMKPLIETAIRLNLVFLIHASEPVGHQYQGKGTITPDVLYPFILSYPGLKLVCAHWGGGLPFYSLMPEVEKALVNTHFDTAATPFLYRQQIFEYATKMSGSRNILFGSDYPLLPPQSIIDQVKSSDISVVDKSAILGGNADRLLSLTH